MSEDKNPPASRCVSGGPLCQRGRRRRSRGGDLNSAASNKLRVMRIGSQRPVYTVVLDAQAQSTKTAPHNKTTQSAMPSDWCRATPLSTFLSCWPAHLFFYRLSPSNSRSTREVAAHPTASGPPLTSFHLAARTTPARRVHHRVQ